MNTQTDDLIKPTLSRTDTPTLSNLWFKAIKSERIKWKSTIAEILLNKPHASTSPLHLTPTPF